MQNWLRYIQERASQSLPNIVNSLEKQVNKHRLNDKGSFVGRHGADAYFRSPLVDFYDGGIFDFDCKKRIRNPESFILCSLIKARLDVRRESGFFAAIPAFWKNNSYCLKYAPKDLACLTKGDTNTSRVDDVRKKKCDF